MRTEYKLFTTKEGIQSHWTFKIFESVFLTIVWRLAGNPILEVIYLILVFIKPQFVFGEIENVEVLMRIPWYVDFGMVYLSMWIGSMMWKKRKERMVKSDPPVTPLISWYLDFVFGLLVFVILQVLMIGVMFVNHQH